MEESYEINYIAVKGGSIKIRPESGHCRPYPGADDPADW